jgi:tRNA 5-methylaminomethyl-2-thiouridine biosynthesis bifunctional protein
MAKPRCAKADHAENLAKLDFILPGYGNGIQARDLAGRVGFRPLSPDRLPMIGAIGDAAAIDPDAPSRQHSPKCRACRVST